MLGPRNMGQKASFWPWRARSLGDKSPVEGQCPGPAVMEGCQGGFLEVVTSAVGFPDVCDLFTVLGQGGREEQTHRLERCGRGPRQPARTAEQERLSSDILQTNLCCDLRKS